MGWNNPPISWHELERTLSNRPGTPMRRGPHAPAASADPTPAPPHNRTHDVEPGPAVPYAELHVHSHYSFLDGASSPDELVSEAYRLGLSGLALTDHNGLYGAARFAEAAAEARTEAAADTAQDNQKDDAPQLPRPLHQPQSELATVYGAELSLELDAPQLGVADPVGSHLLVLARGPEGYRRLASAITEAQLAGGEKGRPVYNIEDLAARGHGHWVILTGCRKGSVPRALQQAESRAAGEDAAAVELDRLTALFGHEQVFVELTDHGHPGDDLRCDRLAALAASHGLPTLVTGGVHYARRETAPLAEAVAAVRARRSLDELDGFLPATGAAHLRSGRTMLRRFARHPDAVARTVPLAHELAFPLRAVRPDLPDLEVPAGHTQMSLLRELATQGVEQRYGWQRPEVLERLERELSVIESKNFSGYFLIVHDIVTEARRRGILCQGRGSAANSVLCYVLGITSVDSVLYDLPFERFLSSMRDEEPDIDVDFDSSRREEIIQYVYTKYGRRSAAQVANVITYRPKAAIRDAALALGYSAGQQRAWTRVLETRGALSSETAPGVPSQVVELASQLLKSPRHLGIHSGGMVLTRRPVGEVCPVEHARMDGRTVLQWDKDDCASMGLVKFDLLGLGMLGAMQITMDAVRQATGEEWTLDTIPKEEPGVYDMLCRGDAIGVFQLESRAQLNTLPRLRPRRFYDLVIEIALIRPGPLQGGAVHPYLRRRDGLEPVTVPHPRLQPVLERTLGVPLFQEQLMQMAMAVGGCSAADADLLRRAMGSKRGVERIEKLEAKLFAGMARNGITGDTAAGIYAQIKSFADFGFAESHSISFALLVYASSWLKLHYPAAFLIGLLQSQPMGFYAPRTLVADARRHGVRVLGPNVQRSQQHASLESLHSTADGGSPQPSAPQEASGMKSCTASQQPPVPPFDPAQSDTSAVHRRDGEFAVRLGLTQVRGIDAAAAGRIVSARARGPFKSLSDLARRADLDRGLIESLAAAGACESLGLNRREALWSASPAANEREKFLPGTAPQVQLPLLPVLTDAEQTALDLWSTGIAVGTHPLEILRDTLDARGIVRSDRTRDAAPGRMVEVAGLVTHRQRPATAGGITFLTLEDETGTVNVITWAKVWQRYRFVAKSSPALIVRGVLERTKEGVVNIIAHHFEPLTSPAAVRSRDFQ